MYGVAQRVLPIIGSQPLLRASTFSARLWLPAAPRCALSVALLHLHLQLRMCFRAHHLHAGALPQIPARRSACLPRGAGRHRVCGRMQPATAVRSAASAAAE